ncbi:hypothetical protein [Streptomyces sp. NPDC001508]|uniref:hypothetical protein n=1 Tax=Streptomyces sp. NPDC001508 TaxID=3154656 RepID=UPI0033287CA2
MWQLSTLQAALEQLDELHDTWLQTRDSLPGHAGPGTELFAAALAAYHAEAWSYLDDWGTHGRTVLDIHSATRHAPMSQGTPHAMTAAPASLLQARAARR